MSTDEPGDFSSDEQRVLSCVLDEIIPPSADGRLPGAGTLGLATRIEEVVGKSPELRPALVQGITALNDLARVRGARDFSELARGDRPDVLNELGATAPGFVPSLVFHTYAAYYQHPGVLEALGREGRPPFPKGYPMEATDFSILDDVRRRTRLFRDA